MINIPRGITVLVHGEYEFENESVDFEVLDTDPGFHVVESELTAPTGFNMRNYEQHLRVLPGDRPCYNSVTGAPCTPATIKYDEYFRFDVMFTAINRLSRFFHRGISVLHKVDHGNIPLF